MSTYIHSEKWRSDLPWQNKMYYMEDLWRVGFKTTCSQASYTDCESQVSY
jgi:hypothetical protein